MQRLALMILSLVASTCGGGGGTRADEWWACSCNIYCIVPESEAAIGWDAGTVEADVCPDVDGSYDEYTIELFVVDNFRAFCRDEGLTDPYCDDAEKEYPQSRIFGFCGWLGDGPEDENWRECDCEPTGDACSRGGQIVLR